MASPESAQKVPKSTARQTPDRRSLAALLVAQDALTDETIAGEVGISRRTLSKWKTQPAFAADVAAIRAKCRARVEAHAIGTLEGRMDRYQRRADALDTVVAERATAGGGAPGAGSGYLVKTFKIVGGQDSYPVEEWQVDTGLLKELRELEKQVSIEQGQWAEKKELTGANGAPLTIQIVERPDGPK